MMSDIRSSANFSWWPDEILGEGGTAFVYKGFNKVTGQKVAVKVLKASTPEYEKLQISECEMLRKIEHKNIVKLLAMEADEKYAGQNVIVMELCTGGSLHQCLNDPENYYGLMESEFILVLEHLCAGVKYLRKQKLIHRDLKPDNIMKYKHDDFYKLTDFESAKKLEDNQSFNSVHGTVEYLNPDIYRNIVHGKSDAKFPATTDLWSIGVTLYRLATRKLPFRPYGGRNNGELLYKITATKKSGVISVTQEEPNGPLKEGKELPASCPLSCGLKKLITPLIANLLERDKEKKINFDTFFTEVDKVLSRKVVHVFHANKMKLIKLFILPGQTYRDLQSYIAEQTGVRGDSQILTHKYFPFGRKCMKDGDIPKTTEAEPLFLFDRESSSITLDPPKKLPKWKNFPDDASMIDDCTYVQRVCVIAHESKRRIEKLVLYSKLIPEAIENYKRYTQMKHNNLVFKNKGFRDKIYFTTLIKYATDPQSVQGACKIHCTKNNTYDKIAEYTCAIMLHKKYKDTIKYLTFYSSEHQAPDRAKSLVTHLRKLWYQINDYMRDPDMPSYYIVLHIDNKNKVKDLMDQINLIEKDVFNSCKHLTDDIEQCYKNARSINSEIDELALQVTNYSN